jgi:hypothetical protein
MTRALADETYSAIHDNGDGTYRALAKDGGGWHTALPGDVLNFGRGVLVTIEGGDQIAGGSIKATMVALLVGFVAIAVAGLFGVGKMGAGS